MNDALPPSPSSASAPASRRVGPGPIGSRPRGEIESREVHLIAGALDADAVRAVVEAAGYDCEMLGRAGDASVASAVEAAANAAAETAERAEEAERAARAEEDVGDNRPLVPPRGPSVAIKPVLLLVDPEALQVLWENDQIRLRHLRRRNVGVVVLAESEAALDGMPESQQAAVLGAWTWPMSASAMGRVLQGALALLSLTHEKAELRRELGRKGRQLRDITAVGIALSAERNLPRLLDMVLTKARAITGADSGSLYLVEGEERDTLRFKHSQNDSIDFPFAEFTMPISAETISGWCVLEREIVNLDDVYAIPEDSPYSHSKDWDLSAGYRSKSMLTVPMINHEGEVTGCLQLINRKRRASDRFDTPEAAERLAIPFDSECVDLVSSFASQAAVSIDNSMLLAAIEQLFEGMVTAATVAIESRDPTTSGHSFRVASLSVGLAKTVCDHGQGRWSDQTFTREQLRELRYAGLLHDFGKVGVREKVLVKAKKLYPWDLELVQLRFAFMKRDFENRRLREAIDQLRGSAGNGDEFDRVLDGMEQTIRDDWAQLDEYLATILSANEPSVLAEGSFEHLTELGQLTYPDLDGQSHPYLTQDEIHSLSIPRGSLNAEERLEIESHVAHTYKFLKTIPWTKDLRNLPEIAAAHHEKLNGAGYPRKLLNVEIPPQSKIMTIADIFDALTAADRPYKKAMPVEKALDILGYEVKDGHLDDELVAMFIEAKVFEWATDEASNL